MYRISQIHYSSIKTPEKPTLLALIEKPYLFKGYIGSYRQLVVSIKLKVHEFNRYHTEKLCRAFHEYFNIYELKFNSIQSEEDLVACLVHGIEGLQTLANFPIFEKVRIDVLPNGFRAWIPYFKEVSFHYCLAFMLQFIAQHLSANSFSFDPALKNEIHELIDVLKKEAPAGVNSLRFLRVAYEENIPQKYIGQNIFQYGYGQFSRWLDSTITDRTPQTSVKLARDKYSSLALLRQAGLPVANHFLVYDENEAVKAASQLGYPVVLKPANQDGGKNVFTHIYSNEQVKKIFNQLQQCEKHILLEKQIIGKDYRLVVLNGKLIWAIERIPASVIGDGVHTIQQLVQHINHHRDAQSHLKRINITEDVLEYLKEQGYGLESIPDHNAFVALSRISNISTGGIPVGVFEKVHPDNQRLAETAAKLLRLDLAGIDLIMPNIQQSYLETSGAMIEINAQPQLGMITAAHIYKQILMNLLPNGGRIPIISICDFSSDDRVIKSLCDILKIKYQKIGIVKKNQAYLNSEVLATSVSSFDAANILLLHPETEILIYHFEHWDDILMNGWPFDQYDLLILMHMPLFQSLEFQLLSYEFIQTLFNYCKGLCMIHKNIIDHFMPLMEMKSTIHQIDDEFPAEINNLHLFSSFTP